MKKKVEKDKNITESKEKYKVAEFYRNVVGNKEHPVSKNWILQLFEDWVKWAREDEKAYNASYFIVYKGIPWATCMNWVEKYPEGKEAYDNVHKLIALRREARMIEANPFNSLAFMMPHYDKDYAKQHEYRSKLKAKEMESQKPNVTVVIPDMEK